MSATKLSNAIAREYFEHARDEDHQTGRKACYFSQDGQPEGWGFWVNVNGIVDIDDASASGETPSARIIDACRRAAVKFLKGR